LFKPNTLQAKRAQDGSGDGGITKLEYPELGDAAATSSVYMNPKMIMLQLEYPVRGAGNSRAPFM
jgi:hypothetical protein